MTMIRSPHGQSHHFYCIGRKLISYISNHKIQVSVSLKNFRRIKPSHICMNHFFEMAKPIVKSARTSSLPYDMRPPFKILGCYTSTTTLKKRFFFIITSIEKNTMSSFWSCCVHELIKEIKKVRSTDIEKHI